MSENEDTKYGRVMLIIIKLLELEEKKSSLDYGEYKNEVLKFDNYLKEKYSGAKKCK